MTRFLFVLAALAMVAGVPPRVQAQTVDNSTITRLDTDSPEAYRFFNALGIYDFLQIVAEESVLGADQIRAEFFPELAPEIWETEMRQLYAVEAMVSGFEAAWDDDALGPDTRSAILTFFESPLGGRIVAAEVAARAGMADPDIAEAARSALRLAQADNDPRIDRFADFSAELGLVDRNVSAMMNAQLQFLTGLSDGGALQPPMPEDALLSFIGSQAAELRSEAEDWLAAYQLMAYGSFDADEFRQFAELNTTGAGRALASAVFAAFDATFDAMQYELGQIAARYAVGDDI